jgi:tetratricopeptide (TPR) repeat protein
MMLRHSLIFVLGITLMGLIGCSVKTPEIHGVVLDEETKQPVEEAWVRATLDLKSKTIQGDVTSYLSVDSPHTRTDKNGKFLIPSKTFKKPPFPIGFGTEAINFGIGAATVDDRGGRINLKGEKLEEFLGKKKIELTIYSGPVERTEAEYSSHLQSLYKYCLTGRSSVEVPPIEGGCDEWELNYAIAKHERYLEKYREHIEKEVNTVIFDHLSYLYEKKGDLNKAVEALKKSIALIERRGLLKFEVWQRNKKEIELQINGLQKKREEGKK